MAEQSSVQGSVTLRKLRTGATATISLSSTKQLFQLYTESAGAVSYAPDWSVSGNEPVVTVNAVTSGGSLTITNVVWRINNTLASTITGITSSSSGGVWSLTIKTNLAQSSILNFNSGTLSAEITFTDDSGATQTVTKTEVIRVQKAVQGGYNVMINCSKAYVDNTTSTSNPTTLSAVIYDGVTQITNPAASNITFYWLKSTTAAIEASTPTGETYDITNPDEINGSQLYICRALDGSNNELDAEGIMIIDNSDPYFISASVQQKKGGSVSGPAQDNVTSVNVASDNDTTEVTFSVMNNNGTSYGSPVYLWTLEKMHADTMALIGKVDGASYTTDTATVDTSYNTKTFSNTQSATISVLDADYVSNSGGANHDTEVIVTATAQLTAPAS